MNDIQSNFESRCVNTKLNLSEYLVTFFEHNKIEKMEPEDDGEVSAASGDKENANGVYFLNSLDCFVNF